MEKITITLDGQVYEGKLDFGTLAKIQNELKKETGTAYTIQDIFEGVQNQDFNVINEIVVQSITRVHKQLKKEHILSKLNFNNMESVFQYIAQLFESAMPKEEEKTGK